MKDINKKYVRIGVIAVIAVLVVLLIVKFFGCSKQKSVPSLTYATVEDKEDEVVITGLTDKGRTDESIVIPATIDDKKVVSIAREAFRDCDNLKSVVIEEGIEQVGENAFFNCTKLENITFPQSVNYIGTNAVKNTAWEKNNLAQSDYLVVNGILIEVKEGKTSYAVPEGVKVIGSGVFYNNTSIAVVTLPKGLEKVDSYAFSGCVKLERVSIPSSIKEVEYGAFSGCVELTVELPSTVERIGIDAFLEVKELKYEGDLID